MSEANIQSSIERAEAYEPATNGSSFSTISSFSTPNSQNDDEPHPLTREIAEPEPFPIEALGPILSRGARSICEQVQAPEAICGQSVLAAAALIAQGYRDVQMPTGQTRPISNFFFTIANSGDRKTTADRMALRPVAEYEAALRASFDEEHLRYRDEVSIWEGERKRILGDRKSSVDDKRRQLAKMEAEPQPPPIPFLTSTEPTWEGLVKQLEKGYPSQGLYSSEGGQFLGGFGMSKDHRLKTATALSSIWDGDPIKRTRAGDGSSMLMGRRLSIHLMVQPAVSTLLLGDRTLQDQGLLSRILLAAPTSLSGTRFFREVGEGSRAEYSRYLEHMSSLIAKPLNWPDPSRGLCLLASEFEPKAAAVWVKFADDVERRLAEDGELWGIRAFANKLPEHAARLAGVMAFVENPDSYVITAEQICRGIELVQYYGSEARRLADAAAVDSDLVLASAVLEWLKSSRWPAPLVSLPDIYQFGPKAVRTRDSAKKMVQILEEHGHLLRTGPGEVQGKKRSEVWRIWKKQP